MGIIAADVTASYSLACECLNSFLMGSAGHNKYLNSGPAWDRCPCHRFIDLPLHSAGNDRSSSTSTRQYRPWPGLRKPSRTLTTRLIFEGPYACQTSTFILRQSRIQYAPERVLSHTHVSSSRFSQSQLRRNVCKNCIETHMLLYQYRQYVVRSCAPRCMIDTHLPARLSELRD